MDFPLLLCHWFSLSSLEKAKQSKLEADGLWSVAKSCQQMGSIWAIPGF